MPQSVQCPRCHHSVSVADDAGGSRVSCPSCSQEFIVPGFSTTTDDDWLNLDDPAPSTSPVDEDLFAEAPPPPPPAPSAVPAMHAPPADVDLDDDFGLEPPSVSPTGTRPANTAGPIAQSTEFESEYRIRCPHCGTPVDLKASQEGKQIRCRDCHGTIRVGKPPRKKKQITLENDAAPAFAFQPATKQDRPADPFRKSADELLAEASKREEEEPEPDFEVPSMRQWAAAVFGIFVQIGVMIHWLALSMIASTVAFIVLSINSQILTFGLFLGGGVFAAVVIACGFAIMQSVANEEEVVSEWPISLEPTEWLGPLAICVVAAALSCAPGWAIGYIPFGNALITVCTSMMSIFVLFPIILLSMLDMQNIFIPFSPDVGRSFRRCEESWGGFYFSSGLLFFLTFLIFAGAYSLPAPAKAVICIFFGVAATFIYFSMLGRLAFAIGHSVNAAPKENDIDSIRESERSEG